MKPFNILRMRKPAAAAATWQTVHTLTPPTNTTSGWNGWTGREQLFASQLADLSGSQLRISVKADSGGLKIAKMYVGLKGTGNYDFASTPTAVLFGGSASVLVSANAVQVSDAVTFTYDGTHDLVISVYHDNTAGYVDSQSILASSLWQKAGDDAATLTPTGGGTGSAMDIIYQLEVFA